MTSPDAIAGLVLAGGRGSRMGGIDKGLQLFRGRPLALHALERLRPQVTATMVSANRHADIYAGWNVAVLPDHDAEFSGPLAGLLAGLQRCPAPWMASVPCDTPFFPHDLVQRLAQGAAAAGTDAAVAWAPDPEGIRRAQPVFCLLHTRLQGPLAAYLASGQRRVMGWLAQHSAAAVHFDDPLAFRNANTLEDLQRLEAG